MNSQNNTLSKISEKPIPLAIIKMAIPTIISMLVLSLYGMTDIFFVSKLGTSASAAVGIVFSILTMMQAVGSMIGIGAGNLLSKSLGEKNLSKASNIASVAFFLSIIFGLLVMTLGIIFKTELMHFLGATKTILPFAEDFAHYLLLASPIMCCSFVLNILLRSQGKPNLSMIGLSFGALTNIFLEPIFIFSLNLGIKGAGIATLCGQVVGFLLLLFLYLKHNNLAKIHFSHIFANTRQYFIAICFGGSPSLLRQGLVVIANVLINIHARSYGDAAIAAFSITNRIALIAVSVLFGLGQGFQPIAGFSYGAKKFDRIKTAYFFTLIFGTIIQTILCFFLYRYASETMTFFQKNSEVVQIGTKILQFIAISLPFIPITIVTNMIFQVAGKIGISIFLSSCRQGIFFLPLIFVLPRFFGIIGLELCQPLANILSAIISIPFIVFYFYQEKRK